jgi:hypothetical protein
MDSSVLGLVELVLIVAVVFGIGLSQIWSLRRDKRARERDQGDPGTPEDR